MGEVDRVLAKLDAELSTTVACTYCRHEFDVGNDIVSKNGPCYSVNPGCRVVCQNVECAAVMMPGRLLVNPEEVVVWEEDDAQDEA